ncbi:MAG: MBL fold metallo-hydrolase [Planctomycetes bacterium]|nr:MBL fold metallo-hydrolase [Planctomycetota bacterium]
MDLGFETIGNACIIAHDRGPVLATDPWLFGPAYFGSWRLSHEVPAEQQANVKACKYIWLSHGHPDHLSLPSLEQLRDKIILLADHVGGRIAKDLQGLGFTIKILRCGEWVELSPRLRIASIANYNQDAVLLMDLDGHLLIDANDAGDRGASRFLARELPRFQKSTFLACLTGYGDADMIHFVDEQGNLVPPAAAKKEPVGPQIAEILHTFGIRYLPAEQFDAPLQPHRLGVGRRVRDTDRRARRRLRQRSRQGAAGVHPVRPARRRHLPDRAKGQRRAAGAASGVRRRLVDAVGSRGCAQAEDLLRSRAASAAQPGLRQPPCRRSRPRDRHRAAAQARHHLRDAAAVADVGDRMAGVRRHPDRQLLQDDIARRLGWTRRQRRAVSRVLAVRHQVRRQRLRVVAGRTAGLFRRVHAPRLHGVRAGAGRSGDGKGTAAVPVAPPLIAQKLQHMACREFPLLRVWKRFFP